MEASRRNFLKASLAAGGGLCLEFSFPLAAAAARGSAPVEVTAWILIHPDDRVVVRIARSEMGQGTYTALAQLVAEELDCDWDRVSAEFASPNASVRRKRPWGSMSTGGSQGVRASQDYVRRAGACARSMLLAAAGSRWQVAPGECSAARGIITHATSGRSLRYGEIAAEAAKLDVPSDVTLRDPKDWKIAGKPLHRLDIPDKVLGRPVFGVDVQLPGMLHAAIAQCPVFGGKLAGVDSAAVEKRKGVKKVVRSGNFVAVIADSWWRADQALQQLKIDWDYGPNAQASDASVMAMLREGLAADKLPQARMTGDGAAALATAARTVQAEYHSPYINHATMEPQTCTAWFKTDGTLEVWTSTQDGEASLAAAAKTAGLAPEKVEVHKMMLGGGFGRRGAPQDFVEQGVIIAKSLPGVPVKLMWSRAEDMQHGYYRPASLVRMTAGLDTEGRLTAMHSVVACPSILKLLLPEMMKSPIDFTAVRTLADMPYTVPHQQVDYAQRNGHVPVGFWRAPGQQNAYYRECFIDEVAHAAGKDPLALRLELLAPGDKNRAVLEAAAWAANWATPPAPGLHRGIALSDGFGSYTAMVMEVAVDAKGTVKVHRVVVAIDSGHVVNPDTCRAQAEGNIAFMIGATLYQENTVKDGRIAESNFHQFRLLALSEMPRVEVLLVPSGGFWGGHGEPGALCVAPALCNAIFAATGRRIRSLPLKHHDLRRA